MHDFTVFVLDGAYPTSVAATVDMLAAADTLAAHAQVAAPRWRLCSPAGGSARLQHGVLVETEALPEGPDRSLWVVPGLGLESGHALLQRLENPDAAMLIERLAGHVEAGGRVAASCSSVFLLRAAGLLRGRRATTTWWLAPLLQQLEPACIVDADRMVHVDGPVITAGAAFAQTDLMLHLLREHCGNALTDLLSRSLLIEARQAQAPFIVPELLASGDALVAQLVKRVEAALPAAPAVAELAREFCMSERTLARHVRRATGKSTSALVQSVRLRRARALLESSRMTIDQVATAVGYRDATALRRLMKKVTGANPSHYRPAVG